MSFIKLLRKRGHRRLWLACLNRWRHRSLVEKATVALGMTLLVLVLPQGAAALSDGTPRG